MKKFVPVLLACLLLMGCGKESTPDTVATETPTTPVVETTAPRETETVPTEPEKEIIVNPLTGEAVALPISSRPFAVMFNNVKPALPQCGVSEADWLFEVLVEGGLTRCMGLFTTLPVEGDLGSIRSARPYYVSLCAGYDAIYVHAGGSDQAYADMRNANLDHIDGVNGPNGESWFYRNQQRLSNGVAWEHTMFISSEKVLAYAENQGCTFQRKDPISYGMTFSEDAAPDGKAANQVTVNFREDGKTTRFTYDSAAGLYGAYQYGGDYIDGNTGKVLAFRNILVLEAETRLHADGNHEIIDLVGSGEGHFICGGKCVPIRWGRRDAKQPFTLTTEDGLPLTLGIGKTYVGIVPTGSPLDLA